VDDRRRSATRLVVAWALLSIVGVLAVVFLLGPVMPPGRATSEASDQTTTNIVVTAIMTPIAIGILLFFGYALSSFRQRGDTIEDGPPIKGNDRIQLGWVLGTTLVVLFLAVYGSYSLVSAQGAGGGQGPDPLFTPGGTPLQIQVIAQQWNWTFRYPSYGGVETTQLALPVGEPVALHVTSLDVIHSFWAYGLGVKADAVPGTDNVAFVTATKTGTFSIRCAEVCGLFHGYMSGNGAVLGRTAFVAWIRRQQVANAPATRVLPPYSKVYFPDPQRLAG
jgi:cytochrome c oxidase subunit 2